MYDEDFEEFDKIASVDKEAAVIENLKESSEYRFKVRGFILFGSEKYFGEFSKEFTAKTA